MAKCKRRLACKRVKGPGGDWYCCCGKVMPGYEGAGETRCKCAPMVGKNRVDARRSVWVKVGKDGKLRKSKEPRRK